MKLHFESNLDYQLAAIEAVCDLFRGQEICRSEFTVTMRTQSVPQGDDLFPGTKPQQLSLGVAESDLGIGNKLTLLDDEIAGLNGVANDFADLVFAFIDDAFANQFKLVFVYFLDRDDITRCDQFIHRINDHAESADLSYVGDAE